MGLKVSQWLAAAMLLAAAFAAVASKAEDAHPDSYKPGPYAKDKGYKDGPDYYPHSDYGYGEKMHGVHCGNNHCQACPDPKCLFGTTECGGLCVDTSSNAKFCYNPKATPPQPTTCGVPCPAGQECSGGQCQCPGGTTECPPGSGVCVPGNDCEFCPTGESCEGPCTCPGTSTPCDDQCVDTASNEDFCKDPANTNQPPCGVKCPEGQVCDGGQCKCPTTTTECPPGSGVCVPGNDCEFCPIGEDCGPLCVADDCRLPFSCVNNRCCINGNGNCDQGPPQCGKGCRQTSDCCNGRCQCPGGGNGPACAGDEVGFCVANN